MNATLQQKNIYQPHLQTLSFSLPHEPGAHAEGKKREPVNKVEFFIVL